MKKPLRRAKTIAEAIAKLENTSGMIIESHERLTIANAELDKVFAEWVPPTSRAAKCKRELVEAMGCIEAALLNELRPVQRFLKRRALRAKNAKPSGKHRSAKAA